MVWVRGQRQDYDHWAQLGNRGWSWQDVLPVFKGIESYARRRRRDARPRRALRSPTSTRAGRSTTACSRRPKASGIPRNRDYNGADQEGIAMTQCSISGGFRMSTAKVYLDPARARRNFRVETGAHARDACCSRARAASACATPCRARHCEARAAREVIVSAGSIASPQLLELSGIGQSERLKALGIAVKHELPRRRREPARPLGAAHEMARRAPRRDLQRARPRPARRWGRDFSTSRSGAASSAIRPRRCAPSSRAARGSTRRTP